MTAFHQGQRVKSRRDGASGRIGTVGRDRLYVKWDDGFTLSYSLSAAEHCLTLAVEHGTPKSDAVEHPSHYIFPGGAEVVHIAKHLPFLRGSAVKYAARAGRKHKETELEDLRKARQCLDLEIERVEAEQ